MKPAEEIQERIKWLQTAKIQLLFPPQEFLGDQADDSVSIATTEPSVTLESLNAEIAALTWVLGVSALAESIPIFEAQAKHVAEQNVPLKQVAK